MTYLPLLREAVDRCEVALARKNEELAISAHDAVLAYACSALDEDEPEARALINRASRAYHATLDHTRAIVVDRCIPRERVYL